MKATKSQLKALDSSIKYYQEEQEKLDNDINYTPVHSENSCACCKEANCDCNKCLLGIIERCDFDDTHFGKMRTFIKGTEKYRQAHREMLCFMQGVRVQCEVEKEQTYKKGDRFIVCSQKSILCQVDDMKYCLIEPSTGNRYQNPVKVQNYNHVTTDEINKMTTLGWQYIEPEKDGKK